MVYGRSSLIVYPHPFIVLVLVTLSIPFIFESKSISIEGRIQHPYQHLQIWIKIHVHIPINSQISADDFAKITWSLNYWNVIELETSFLLSLSRSICSLLRWTEYYCVALHDAKNFLTEFCLIHGKMPHHNE